LKTDRFRDWGFVRRVSAVHVVIVVAGRVIGVVRIAMGVLQLQTDLHLVVESTGLESLVWKGFGAVAVKALALA
jgi:hypothetical protein